MANKTLEELRGLSREERMEYFKAHRRELKDEGLEAVNGGAASVMLGENPNSDCPYNGCYFTSFGWVCDDEFC